MSKIKRFWLQLTDDSRRINKALEKPGNQIVVKPRWWRRKLLKSKGD